MLINSKSMKRTIFASSPQEKGNKNKIVNKQPLCVCVCVSILHSPQDKDNYVSKQLNPTYSISFLIHLPNISYFSMGFSLAELRKFFSSSKFPTNYSSHTHTHTRTHLVLFVSSKKQFYNFIHYLLDQNNYSIP